MVNVNEGLKDKGLRDADGRRTDGRKEENEGGEGRTNTTTNKDKKDAFKDDGRDVHLL